MSASIAPDVHRIVDASRDAGRGLVWSEVIRSFVQDLRKRGYSVLTLRDYRSDIAQLSTMTQALPEEVDDDVLQEAWFGLKRAGFGPAVLRRKRAAHHAFLQFLKSKRRPEPLAVALWRMAASEPPADRVLLGLIITAGARLSEIPAMEGRDIRLAERHGPHP